MTTKTVSYSELDTLRQCRLKHHLAYQQHWKKETTSPALQRGTLFHAVMQLHYQRMKEGMKLAGIIQEVQTSGLLFDPDTGEADEMQETVAWIYDGYVRLYGEDPEWEVLWVEERLHEWLPTENGNRSTFKLKGTPDLLIRHRRIGGLWIVDHKTCRDLPKGKDLDFDDQAALYAYLWRRKGLDIRGVIFNHCRTQKLKSREMEDGERFRRTLTARTEKELKIVAQEALDTFREAYRPRREGSLPPRSPDPDRCGWRCPYTEACLGGRKGISLVKLLEDHEFVQDPTDREGNPLQFFK